MGMGMEIHNPYGKPPYKLLSSTLTCLGQADYSPLFLFLYKFEVL